MTLWDLSRHQEAEITELSSSLETAVSERLEEMGISTGQLVKCLRRAPLNGPTLLQLGGSAFALEQAIAQAVSVRPIA